MSELAIYDGLTLIGVTRERNGRCEALAVPGERMIGVFPTSAKAASAIYEEYSLRQKARTPEVDT
jgi:hypothetical protein